TAIADDSASELQSALRILIDAGSAVIKSRARLPSRINVRIGSDHLRPPCRPRRGARMAREDDQVAPVRGARRCGYRAHLAHARCQRRAHEAAREPATEAPALGDAQTDL